MYDVIADGDTQSSDAKEEEDEDHAVISCDECGGMMNDSAGSTWYKCAECDDVDICSACYEKEAYSHHQRCRFTCPSDWLSAYCDSCGVVFAIDRQGNMFQCKMCEDYCICH